MIYPSKNELKTYSYRGSNAFFTKGNYSNRGSNARFTRENLFEPLFPADTALAADSSSPIQAGKSKSTPLLSSSPFTMIHSPLTVNRPSPFDLRLSTIKTIQTIYTI